MWYSFISSLMFVINFINGYLNDINLHTVRNKPFTFLIHLIIRNLNIVYISFLRMDSYFHKVLLPGITSWGAEDCHNTYITYAFKEFSLMNCFIYFLLFCFCLLFTSDIASFFLNVVLCFTLCVKCFYWRV